MKGTSKAPADLALLESTTVAAPAVKSFGDKVAKTFLEIAQTERMNAARAILIGMSLPVIKASLPRGEFRPWLEANVTKGNIWTKATAIKNASFFTRLAGKFLDEAKLDGAAVLAITNGKTVLGKPGKNPEAAKLMEAITAFVGERSLNELLEAHGVKGGAGTGLASTPAGALAALPADDNTLLQDIAEAMLSLRKTVTDPDTLKRLTAAQINQLQQQLDDTQEDFRKALQSLQAK